MYSLTKRALVVWRAGDVIAFNSKGELRYAQLRSSVQRVDAGKVQKRKKKQKKSLEPDKPPMQFFVESVFIEEESEEESPEPAVEPVLPAIPNETAPLSATNDNDELQGDSVEYAIVTNRIPLRERGRIYHIVAAGLKPLNIYNPKPGFKTH